MIKVLYDVETDDLFPGLSEMWMLVAHDLTNNVRYEFLQGDTGWKELFKNASTVIGHNIIGFDNRVLKKLYDYDFPEHVKFIDTLLMSQVQDYRRFGYKGHSMKVWGEALGNHKGDFTEYSYNPETSIYGSREEWHEAMREYCHDDVSLNIEIFEYLCSELRKYSEFAPYLKTYLRAEHSAAEWQATAETHGWPFDKEGAQVLFNELDERLIDIRNRLEPLLGWKSIIKDKESGEVVVKTPKWVKNGYYHSHTSSWFNIPPECGSDILEEDEIDEILANPDIELFGEEILKVAEAVNKYGVRPVDGPFCRVEFEEMSLSSPADVKVFLFRHGWEPSEWNVKKDEETGEMIQTSPKIVDDDLELLGGDGALYTEFKSLSSRHSIVKTWLEEVDADGRLHGESMVVGTPSMRTRHQIIVNVPSGELDDEGNAIRAYGPEMRKLFRGLPGYTLIGCDSKGNQARGLAFYINNPEFTDVILNRDIHEYNKDKLNDVLESMGYGRICERSQAKRILYAFLLGASGAKIWSYIFGNLDTTLGNKLKAGFTSAVPGFKELIDKLKKVYKATSKKGFGYIVSHAGNKIYVDSTHKLLVYLLQSLEKITCSTALMLTQKRLKENNIPYIPLIFYHDEIDFMVPNEYAAKAAEIGAQAFDDGPRMYNINIMGGDSKTGETWYDIH